MNKFKEYIGPSLVLVVICLVVTAALAGTYQITKPVIEAITKANADAARAEVLPSGAEGFSPVDKSFQEGIADVYTADNSSGVVITALDKGFGGEIAVMVGIDGSGQITGVKVLDHTETPGLGTKAMTETHLSQYRGKTKISNSSEADPTYIDAITGATVTSNAVFRAVDKALHQYAELGGAK